MAGAADQADRGRVPGVSRATEGASADRTRWADALSLVEGPMADAVEADVTGYDATPDLERRARRWGHRMPSSTLPDVLAFGVALADVEIESWGEDDPVIATRAFEDRRFLLSDRVVHWVVPLSFVFDGPGTEDLRSALLELGDRLRPAPAMTGTEGLHPPGEDSYGPTARGLVIGLGDPARWTALAADHPGTARLWLDLARRASEQPFAPGELEGPTDGVGTG